MVKTGKKYRIVRGPLKFRIECDGDPLELGGRSTWSSFGQARLILEAELEEGDQIVLGFDEEVLEQLEEEAAPAAAELEEMLEQGGPADDDDTAGGELGPAIDLQAAPPGAAEAIAEAAETNRKIIEKAKSKPRKRKASSKASSKRKASPRK